VQIDRRKIETGLSRKGFVREDTHHRYFYHEYLGKRTGVFTFTSHGSSYRTYFDALLRSVANQLRLDKVTQVEELVMCPMSAEHYSAILKAKGVIVDEPPPTSRQANRKKKRRRRR